MNPYYTFLHQLDDTAEKDIESPIKCLQRFVENVNNLLNDYPKERKAMNLQEHKKKVEQNLLNLSQFIPKRELAIDAAGVPFLDENKNFVYIQRGENPEIKAMYNVLSALYEYINAIHSFSPTGLHQSSGSDDSALTPAIFGSAFHGESWYKCPQCNKSFEFHFAYVDDMKRRLCPNCKKSYIPD